MAAQVFALLSRSVRRYPALPAVAARLKVSSRTLKRKLAQHGVTYSELLDETRLRRSVDLLRDRGRTVRSIAARLGYTAAANFNRAFVRWTGSTPGAYRTRELNRGVHHQGKETE